MECHNKHPDGRCEIVTHLIGEPYAVNDAACIDCQQQAKPQTINRVTASIALAARKRLGKHPSQELLDIVAKKPPATGPGTELEKLIPKFFQSKKCSCKNYARRMNEWKVDGCERRFNEIVDHLVGEAQKHKLLSVFGDKPARVVAAKLLRKAIDAARPDVLGDLTTQDSDKLKSDWPFVWTYFANGAVGDELKFSIRSVLHWHPDAQIYIVGDRPDWYVGNMF